MSTFNPNVFYELGIRTALDKSVVLVVDDQTKKLPFDTDIINRCVYNSLLKSWTVRNDQKAIIKHIQDTISTDPDRNAMWKIFGTFQPGSFKEEDSEIGRKVDLLLNMFQTIRREKMFDRPDFLNISKPDDLRIRRDLIKALKSHESSIQKTAEFLDLTVENLMALIDRYGIKKENLKI